MGCSPRNFLEIGYPNTVTLSHRHTTPIPKHTYSNWFMVRDRIGLMPTVHVFGQDTRHDTTQQLYKVFSLSWCFEFVWNFYSTNWCRCLVVRVLNFSLSLSLELLPLSLRSLNCRSTNSLCTKNLKPKTKPDLVASFQLTNDNYCI